MNKVKERIINYLVLQVSQMEDSGLYHGRLGVILALFCHGKVYGDRRMCDFATDMFQTHTHSYHEGDVGLEKGLAGLGLGIILLYEAGMFQDDLNELLHDVDTRIMERDPRRIADYTFRNGALGILYYARRRMSLDQECTTLQVDYVNELAESVRKVSSLSGQQETLLSSLCAPVWDMSEYLEHEIGLDNGSSYFLIQDNYDKIFSI